MLRNTTKELWARVSHFLPSRLLHNFPCPSLSLQETSCWHLAPASSALCHSGRYSNSTHRATFPSYYGGWDLSQLKSSTGFLLASDAAPCHLQFRARPRLTHSDAQHLPVLDGPGTSHQSHCHCWLLPGCPSVIPIIKQPRVNSGPAAGTPFLLLYILCA